MSASSKYLSGFGFLSLLAMTAVGLGSLSMLPDRIEITLQDSSASSDADGLELLRDEFQQLRADLSSLSTALKVNMLALRESLAERAPAMPAPQLAAQDDPVPPRSGKFLAFDLPSEDFHFDRLQSFRLIPSLSRVGFDAKSTLHDFSGATKRVRGDLRTNLSRADRACSGSIKVQAKTLSTGLESRDAEMYAHLATDLYPDIEFVIQSCKVEHADTSDMTLAGEISGRMSIHGQSKPFEMRVTGRVDSSRRLQVVGEAGLKMSDFGIEVPTQLGVIGMEDEVKIWISLRFRSLGGKSETLPEDKGSPLK